MKTEFDKIAEKAGDAQLEAWAAKVKAANEDIITFVGRNLKTQVPGEFVNYLQGAYNVSLVIRYTGKDTVIIRFPKRGIVATDSLDEKVRNEVRFMKYLDKQTTIPVPKIRDWGLAKDSPSQLGPYIIMDYVEGTELWTILQQPKEDNEAIIDFAYEQIADYML